MVKTGFEDLSKIAKSRLDITIEDFTQNFNTSYSILFGKEEDTFIKRIVDVAVRLRGESLLNEIFGKLHEGYNIFIELDSINNINPHLISFAIEQFKERE